MNHQDSRLSRRAFGMGLAATIAIANVKGTRLPAEPEKIAKLIDTNVTLSRWPTRRLPLDETAKLVEKLAAQGVTQAWAGTFDGLLTKDMRSANARLAEECKGDRRSILVPFGSINPKLPDWEEDFRLCAEVHRMRGVRFHPNYHGYRLDDSLFAHALSMAAERGIVTQIVLHMEDERMMHPLLQVEPVDAAPLVELVPRIAGAKIVLLNALNLLVGEKLTRALAAGDVSVEISTLEGVGGLDGLLATIPLSRVVFGSHAPLFYLESAALKLKESELSAAQLDAIRFENATRLLG